MKTIDTYQLYRLYVPFNKRDELMRSHGYTHLISIRKVASGNTFDSPAIAIKSSELKANVKGLITELDQVINKTLNQN